MRCSKLRYYSDLELAGTSKKTLKTSFSRCTYINFEDFEFEEIDTAKKLNEFVKSKISDSEKYYLFLMKFSM